MADRSPESLSPSPGAFDAWAPGCVLFLAPEETEVAAAEAAGLEVAYRVAQVPAHRRVVVRPGPEGLALAGFAAIEEAFRARGPGGPRLATPAADVVRAARVAGWLDTLRDLAPEARLVPAALAHRLDVARARLGWEAARLTDEYGRATPTLATDGVLWRGTDDPTGSQIQHYGLWHQHVWVAATETSPEAANDAASAPYEEARRLAWRVARRFWHPFFAITVGPQDDHVEAPWRLLGLTDGQLAGPAGCGLAPTDFYQRLAAGLDPRRAALAAAQDLALASPVTS